LRGGVVKWGNNVNPTTNALKVDYVYLNEYCEDCDDDVDESVKSNKNRKKEIESTIDDASKFDSTLVCIASTVASTVTPTATILDSEALWIADTGATSHVTKFTTGGDQPA
jgi:hypothetical protein